VRRVECHPNIEREDGIVEVQVRGYGWRRHGGQLIVRLVEWHPNIEEGDGIVEIPVRVSGWRRDGRRLIVWRAE
jgi:hypothetical protein